jgi:hypothetical protein
VGLGHLLSGAGLDSEGGFESAAYSVNKGVAVIGMSLRLLPE